MSDPTEPEPVDAEFEPADDAPQTPAKRKPGGIGGYFLTFLIAALAGGGLGGWIAWTLDRTSAEPAGINRLEARLSELESAPGPAVFDASGLEARLSDLESAPEPDAIDLTAIEARLDALEAAASAGAADPDLTNRLAALETSVEQNAALAHQALDQLGALSGGVDPAVLTALDARLSALETASSSADVIDLSPIETRLAALESIEIPVQADIAPLESRISALEAIPAADLTGLTGRIEALENRLAERAERRADGATSDRQLAARSLALVALIEAARSGQSFEAERAALARLWPGPAALDALAVHARSGMPDRETLANTYPRQEMEDAIGTNRVFFGLIEVRPSSGGETGPLARVALASERLDRADLAGAVLLTEQLEGPALEAAQGWLVQARARLATDAALDDLRAALAAEAEADPT
ncbi:MAG: hypothetical protein GC188_02435 [Alphaproteobacteria bacterium]|nr:hypothetical protein [Alphaproteobacteria bacterium]